MIPRRQFMGGLVVATGALAACSEMGVEGGGQSASSTSAVPLSAQDLEDALVGSSYLGTGGGGSLAAARELVAADLAAGHTFSVLTVAELGDEDSVACPYGLASLAPMSAEMEAKLEATENRVDEPVQAAFSVLEEHLGTKLSAVILGEIGPLSLAEALSTAARLGVPALDADTVGRAVPEINQHSVKVAGIPLTPIGAATPFGDKMVVSELGDPSRAEDVLRAVAEASQVCGVADSPITGAQAKQEGVLVKDSLTLARTIGAAVRVAKADGSDPLAAALKAGGGYLLFTGTVSDFDWRDEDGFLKGDLTLTGTGDFAGQQFVTQYINEHLIARRDGEVVATCPDLISVIDLETYDGLSNPDFERGMPVAAIGFRCDPLWRSEAGLSVFSPGYFGFDVPYVPIEELI
ncbi:DUF917 domain-containing protein [Erythrobacter sp. YT30]|uniref:DUF917 domain-containing protein n=1 Tax=Erythrobacter sp. YT30 TaxID=1735012 RepID=UPI000AEDAD50|nr:DUF917 domain-containing protein [Erythrobacter sp. YT30]